jgi:hypothetical protein
MVGSLVAKHTEGNGCAIRLPDRWHLCVAEHGAAPFFWVVFEQRHVVGVQHSTQSAISKGMSVRLLERAKGNHERATGHVWKAGILIAILFEFCREGIGEPVSAPAA